MNSQKSFTSIKKSPRYYIVEFIGRGRKPLIKKLDIVVSSWVFSVEKTKKIVAKFPDPPYDMLHNFLKNELPADSSWPIYTVKIRGRAESIAEAESKLQLLNNKESAFTLSSGEDSSDAEKREISAIKKRQFMETIDQYKGTIHKKSQDNFSKSSNSLTTNTVSKVDDTKRNLSPSNSTKPSMAPKNILSSKMIQSKKQLEYNLKQQQIKSESFQEIVIDYLSNITNLIINLTGEVNTNNEEIRGLKSLVVQNSQVSLKNSIVDCKELGSKYNYTIPFSSMEEFQDFDIALNNKDSLMNDVKSTLLSGIDGSLVISKCLVNMLKMFLSREVAMQFTATKKTKSKFVMRSTNLYMCIERVIKERRTLANMTVAEKEFKTALSHVLTNAVSWRGSNKKVEKEYMKVVDDTTDFQTDSDTLQISEEMLLAIGEEDVGEDEDEDEDEEFETDEKLLVPYF